MRGRFVTFEGIDGSGKSSAMRAVSKSLGDVPHRTTREETDHWTGDAVRRAIKERAPPLTTLWLFLADRAQHMPQIEARLAKGDAVLCDRHLESTLAYQGVTLAGSRSDVRAWLRNLHVGRVADHVLLFDVAPEIAVERAKGRGATTPYEKVEFLQKVRQAYLDLAVAEPERFTILDAGLPQADVAAAAVEAVRQQL